MFTIGPYLVILRKGEAITNKIGKIVIIVMLFDHNSGIVIITHHIRMDINTIFIGKTQGIAEHGRKTGDLCDCLLS